MPLTSPVDIGNIRHILSNIKLMWNYNLYPTVLTREEICKINDMAYIDRYKFFYTKKSFSFVLRDLSLIGFETKESGFFYFQSPFKSSSRLYREYNDNTNFYQISDFLTDELEEKQTSFYARYDYSEDQYREGVHPVSHIHLGVDTEIRIACERKLKPLSFILFILRQFYPQDWINFLTIASLSSHRTTALKSIRENLDEVQSVYRRGKDLYEMYFV